MPKRMAIAPHLSEEELYQRYHQSQDVTQKTYY